MKFSCLGNEKMVLQKQKKKYQKKKNVWKYSTQICKLQDAISCFSGQVQLPKRAQCLMPFISYFEGAVRLEWAFSISYTFSISFTMSL